MTSPAKPSPQVIRRRRLFVLLGALVLIAGVVLGIVLANGNREAPDPIVLDPLPGETIIGPTPTPAVAPIERDKSTALLAALPDAVLDRSVSAQAPQDLAGVAASFGSTALPLEAYTLTYSGGTETTAGDLTLTVIQWRTAEQAAAAFTTSQTEGTDVRAEAVMAGGQEVGQMRATMMTVDPAATPGPGVEGTSAVTWTNGTVLFRALGPGYSAITFYDAFGM